MKSFSFAALAAALVSLSAVPAYAGSNTYPGAGACNNARMAVSAARNSGHESDLPAHIHKTLQQCVGFERQQAKQQQPAAPKKVGFGWMFR